MTTDRWTSMVCLAMALGVMGAAGCGPKPTPDDRTLRRPEIVRETDGRRWFVSGGKRYPLAAVDPRDSYRGPRVTARLPDFDKPPPDRYMLDELGWVTPVDNQLLRGACTIFAALGVIESEYLRQHGLSLDLSEQYVIAMMNENRHPAWVGGAAAEKLLVASYYAVPPEEAWAYVDEAPMMQRVASVFGVDRAADPAAAGALDARLWTEPLARDLGNYGAAVYPSAAAHQAAVYGPMPGAVAAVPLDGTAAPFEKVIAAGHAIAFGTDMQFWSKNAAGTFVYGTGTMAGGHAMVLVGYDRTRQVFRVKNSWGTGFEQGGFAEASYELITKTADDAMYVTALRPPGQPSPGAGTGALRGFWRGGIGGGDAVAVLRHPLVDPVGLNLAGSDAGTLYLTGATRGLVWVSGSPTTMTLDVTGDPVVKRITLTRDGDGWALSGTGSQEGRAVTIGGRWCRTSDASPKTLSPPTYAAAIHDPQVFPDGACRTSASWQSSVPTPRPQ